jgi:peptidoglycan-associated lipoprotein
MKIMAGWSLFATFPIVMALASCASKDVKTDTVIGAPETSAPMASNNDTVDTAQASELKVVYFSFDSSNLSKEARESLKANASWLKDHTSANLQIEGHCDERGTTEYNLALGEKRANAVKTYLTRLGIDSSRLSVISYGSERPVDAGHDEAAWAKNRRAVPTLLPSHLSQVT